MVWIQLIVRVRVFCQRVWYKDLLLEDPIPTFIVPTLHVPQDTSLLSKLEMVSDPTSNSIATPTPTLTLPCP